MSPSLKASIQLIVYTNALPMLRIHKTQSQYCTFVFFILYYAIFVFDDHHHSPSIGSTVPSPVQKLDPPTTTNTQTTTASAHTRPHTHTTEGGSTQHYIVLGTNHSTARTEKGIIE